MVRIVFIGNEFNERLKILKTLDNSEIIIVNGINEETILNNIPNKTVDLFIVDKTKPLFRKIITLINSNISLNHIPIISLITIKDIKNKIINDGDLFISENVSDIEFKYYVKTMVKMKLMDDELKKEKIVLELKVKERTQELENKAERLNITLNSIGDGVIVTDDKGYVTSMNPIAANLCEMSVEEYTKYKVDDIFEIYTGDERVSIFNIVSTTKRTYHLPLDSLIIASSKEQIRISDSASPMINKNGDFTGMVLVFHDITEEYELRKNILSNEQKYKRIYDSVPDIIYTHNLDGIITSMNKNISIIGYDIDELVGVNILTSVLDEENQKIAIKNLKNKTENPNVTTSYDIEVTTKSGEKKILEINSKLIEDGGKLEVFAIARDVTEKILSERIIIEEQERYRNIINNMKSCVAVYETRNSGKTFIFTGWNNAAEKLEGIKKEDILNKNILDLFPEVGGSAFMNDLKYVYDTGISKSCEPFYYKNKTKSISGWRRNFIYKIKSTNEVVVIYDDITNQIEYQDKLERAKEKAENSDKIKSVFISNMSHEIRTPMNSIIGFASLLEYEKNPMKVKSYVDIITNSGNLLLTLIDDIMDLSKMESGNMKITKKPFNIRHLFKDLKEQFSLELNNRGKSNISLIAPNNKNKIIYTDYKRLNQIMINLIMNSIKFTHYGSIKFGFKVKDDYIEFYVKDTGMGIEKRNIEKIFDRFYQIDREKHKIQEGTGLGLTICKAILDLLGGDIKVESKYGKGTNIKFTIPIEEHLNEIIEEKPKPSKLDITCKGKKVLIIEDNDINYELLEIILLSHGLLVERAKNHKLFFEKMTNGIKYDLILLDIQLPEVSGWDLLDWLKDNNPTLPVIVQTANVSDDNRNKALENGAIGFISKPINASELLNLIKTICKNHHL